MKLQAPSLVGEGWGEGAYKFINPERLYNNTLYCTNIAQKNKSISSTHKKGTTFAVPLIYSLLVYGLSVGCAPLTS